ncbi:hypothetical protein K469DRAFT_678604 [Zopfia rhizophila CBS 207.26]|uniref:Zn(2)-C6 fungal-type domain-containing protein n=1 Tax=Zopfia rhizophila CBS 207.26 TaxID=1314779 RepID=A0A6A6DA72_9PEZI|nr:hypothetical protein K469DRAFT_678604 [Zopfia rhizophila CBS 207.26]
MPTSNDTLWPNADQGLEAGTRPESNVAPAEEPALEPPNKRRCRATTAKFTHRKRAVAACQFCRLRKTKCDNVRPVCGFCRHHKAQCIWGDRLEDRSQYDDADREILERLDEIKLLLHSTWPPSLPFLPGQAHPNATLLQDVLPTSPASVAVHGGSHLPCGGPRLSPYTAACSESLLKWPVFEGVISVSDARIDSFLLESDAEPNADEHDPAPIVAQGIQEEDFVHLCRKFLTNVHLRNPILEGDELNEYAKHAAENGLKWDAASCLVLLACALACYTRPWVWEPPQTASGEGDPLRPPAVLREEDIFAAQAYYLAARKRIGLLGSSIIDFQCLFFASVFERHSLNLLQAWFYVQQASSRLQAHLMRRAKGYQCDADTSEHASTHHLEQRVFWSVFKAEKELLPELGFRSSGIEDLAYPGTMFPSPPPILTGLDPSSPASPQDQGRTQEERSWFFYLAEISLRRTINDTLWLLYHKGEQYWLTHIDSLVRQHAESEKEIALWYSHLPSSIRFDPSGQPNNELSFYLQGRFQDWREYILRPLLYYALHHPTEHKPTQQILACAQESVNVCANSIIYNNHHYRHGGTWFTCRRTFTAALIILAVVLKGERGLQPPANWHSLMKMALTTLGRWGAEAADVEHMRVTLERLFQETCRRTVIPAT